MTKAYLLCISSQNVPTVPVFCQSPLLLAVDHFEWLHLDSVPLFCVIKSRLAQLLTAFQNTQNTIHNMDLLTKLHLILHVTAGISTLIAGPVAIFYNYKDVRKHRLAGKVFFYAMLYVCASAIVGYFRHSDMVFYQFLLGIAILVLAGILRGVRAIMIMKGDQVRPFDWVYSVLLVVFGCWMIHRGIGYFHAGESAMFTVLFCVFGFGSINDAAAMLRMYWKAAGLHRLDWYKAHVVSMIGAMTASTTAFMVNIASATLPWYIVWFGPTLLFIPVQVYFVRQVKAWKRAADLKAAVVA
jgi:phosphate starvation-inducible membrane PsiE